MTSRKTTFALSDGTPSPARDGAVVRAGSARFTVLTSRLIRLEYAEDGRFHDERTSLVVNRDFPVPDFTVTREGGGVEILTDHLRLRYAGGPFTASSLSVALIAAKADNHYTTWRYGQSYPQAMPKRGNLLATARTLDFADGAIPLEEGFLATWGFGVLDDSTSPLFSADGWIEGRPAAARPDAIHLDLYFFGYGRAYTDALDDYHALTGPVPMVPRYVLGNWWSRYWAYSEDTYLQVMDRFEAERVPLSVAVIDMDWHRVDIDPAIGTGWTGYSWNTDLFPDPPRFLGALHDRGLAVTLNVHPADGVRRHEVAYPAMAHELGLDPTEGTRIEFDVTDREFVDAYLRHLHHPLEEQGVDFWWVDWQSGGATSIPGLDPLWMLNHIHYLDSGRAGRRPLTFSRYAGPGSHRYPVGFSGDTIVTWASLDFQPYFTATAANIGYPWWSHDVGGHMHGVRDVELATRWFQLGVFSPVNRLHSSNSPFATKEPWSYGPQAERIMTAYLRLRHRLVPYLYTAAWRTHLENRALVRPLYHQDPHVREAYLSPNTAYVGDDLLLAPITSPEDPESHLASVHTWLPEGTWHDLFTGTVHRGGRRASFHRPLRQYPVLARGGAVLPLQADPQADVRKNPDHLELRVIPGTGTSRLSEDDVDGVPGPNDRRVSVLDQHLAVQDDGSARITVTVRPPEGPRYEAPRRVTLDVASVVGVRKCSVRVGDEVRELCGRVHRDELLASAWRVDLGEVDLNAGVQVVLDGARPRETDLAADAFELLDRAEISFDAKEQAWAAAQQCAPEDLVTGVTSIDLPQGLRDALAEVALSRPVW